MAVGGGIISGDGLTIAWDEAAPLGVNPYVVRPAQPTEWKQPAPVMLVCPTCFAEVQANNARRHEQWHDALNGMLERIA